MEFVNDGILSEGLRRPWCDLGVGNLGLGTTAPGRGGSWQGPGRVSWRGPAATWALSSVLYTAGSEQLSAQLELLHFEQDLSPAHRAVQSRAGMRRGELPCV